MGLSVERGGSGGSRASPRTPQRWASPRTGGGGLAQDGLPARGLDSRSEAGMTGKWEWGNNGFGAEGRREEGRGPFDFPQEGRGPFDFRQGERNAAPPGWPFDFPQGERGVGGPGVGASGGGESLFAPTKLGGGSRVRDPILTFPFVRGRDFWGLGAARALRRA